MPTMLSIDGRVGEGGGQLIRTAVALAALSGQSLRVDNVRGNRPGGGGLRPQHTAAVAWLAEATGATTTGIATGSTSFTFAPKHRQLPAGCGSSRASPIVLRAATEAASAALMLQAVLPYLLFGASVEEAEETIHLTLFGGTHVMNAPTYDYLDQVLFPTLEDWFGVRAERALVRRGWNTGPVTADETGHVTLVIHRPPQLVPRFYSLAPKEEEKKLITAVEATVYAPAALLEPLVDALAHEVALCDVLGRGGGGGSNDLQFRAVEDSGHATRVYVLLVARTAGDADKNIPVRRWGRDYLGRGNVLQPKGLKGGKTGKKGGKPGRGSVPPPPPGVDLGAACDRIASKVVGDLAGDVATGACGDEYLQDQVVVFQALAAGSTSFWRGQPEEEEEGEELVKKKEDDDADGLADAVAKLDVSADKRKPFGEGSLHAATARWVTSELLPGVRWSSNGTVCRGIGTTRL